MKDTEIRQSIAYYEHLDGLKIDTQTKLAEVQQAIESGTGGPDNAQILEAKKSTLSNDLKRYDSDQAKTQEKIKARLVAIKVPWIESTSSATSAKENP